MAIGSKMGRGVDALARSAAKKGSSIFARSVYWRDGEVKYIQFVSSLDDCELFPYYKVRVGTKNGKAMMRDFIDPRPFVDDPYNPIADRFPEVQPRENSAAVVVELDRKKSGTKYVYEIATHTFEKQSGEQFEEPNVGVVIMTSNLFFNWFVSFTIENECDVRDYIYKVERVEGSSPVKYNISPVMNHAPLELSDGVTQAVNLDEYLRALMSPERYHEYIDPLDDDAVLNQWAQKTAKEEPNDEEVEASNASADRRSKFRDLKTKLDSQKS